MGERIEFPDNAERLLAKAQQALEKGQLSLAEECAQQAYVSRPNEISHQLYFKILRLQGYEAEAVDLAEEHLDHFLAQKESAQAYFQVLLADRQWQKAEDWLKKIEEHAPFLQESDQQAMKDWLYQAQQADHEEKEELKQANLKKLYQLSNYSPLEQLDILKASSSIEKEELKPAFLNLLTNPYASEMAKTYCLLYLKDMDPKGKLKLEWFGHLKQVNLAELDDLQEMAVVKELQDLLDLHYKNRPVEYQMIQAEMNYHMMLLYPFNEEVVEDADFWLGLYMSPISADSLEQGQWNEKEEKMIWRFQQLTKGN